MIKTFKISCDNRYYSSTNFIIEDPLDPLDIIYKHFEVGSYYNFTQDICYLCENNINLITKVKILATEEIFIGLECYFCKDKDSLILSKDHLNYVLKQKKTKYILI